MKIYVPSTYYIGYWSNSLIYDDQGQKIGVSPCGYSTSGSFVEQDNSLFWEERRTPSGCDIVHAKTLGCRMRSGSKEFIFDTPGWINAARGTQSTETYMRYVCRPTPGRHFLIELGIGTYRATGLSGYCMWRLACKWYSKYDGKLRECIAAAVFTISRDNRILDVYEERYNVDNVSSAEIRMILGSFKPYYLPKPISGYHPVEWTFDVASAAIYTLSQEILKVSNWMIATDGSTSERTVGPYQMSLVSNPGSLSDMLLLDELSLLKEGYSLKPYCGYHLKSLQQGAYLDALDHVPQLNENTLSNVIELVGFIKALVIDHRIEIPKSLSSAWLSYRYQFTTTKLDADEAISFVERHVDSDFLARGFSCYGTFTDEISGTSVTCRCRIDMRQKEMTYLNQIWTALYRYGLSPSFYVVWDMIPYSFIVDWFIPVGDILNGYDKTRMYDREYEMTDIWFSIKYSKTGEQSFQSYARWHSDALPEFQGYYTLENKGSPSNKVLGFRVLDALSLIFK